MRLEFTDTLKGDLIDIIGFKLGENEQINSKLCIIDWTLEIKCSTNGVKYWETVIKKFKIELTIGDITTLQGRKVEFDEGSDEYEIEINKDDYKMSSDFTISSIEIDRKLKTVNAFIK